MSRTTILNKIATFILSGGRRTTASGTRDVLTEMANSYVSAIYDTAANFTTNNPTLETKQLGIETDDLTTSPKFKIGDGVTDWNTLPYNGGSSVWGGISGDINDQTDLMSVLNAKGNFTFQNTQLASSATPAIDTTGYNKTYAEILGLATNPNMSTDLTVSNNYGDELIISFYDNGTSRTITWGALFTNKGAILPTQTVPGKRHTVRCIYDVNVPIWMCVEAKVEDSNNFQTKVVSASLTALMGTKHINVATSTYTDPSPVEGMGYEVYVLNGTATVGGTAYSVAGTTIYRYYHSGSWISKAYTGNETAASIGALIDGSLAATPNDTDLVATAESSVLKKITWTNVKAFLKTYFDTLYQSILISGTNIKTVNSTSLLGSGNVSVGTILGTTSSTSGVVFIGSGVANTATTDANLLYTSSAFYVGGSTVGNFPGNRIRLNTTGATAFSQSFFNSTTTGYSGLVLEQSSTLFCAFGRYNSAYAGNYTGTSLALANSFEFYAGPSRNLPIVRSGTPIVDITGVTGTNGGTRLDTIGLRVSTIATVHTANVNRFHVDGASGTSINTITTTTTLDITYSTVLCDTTSGAITVNLPAANTCTGRIYVIKKIDSSVNAATIDGNSSETIDGATTVVLATQWSGKVIQSNGTSWFIIGSF